ncbi:hypothetical protein GNE08_05025 [Trichormus variabilis ARAD]|uniref:Uncharacterized protein n=1 Tax=Trichormus variabilis N2B TaxID=2681315 RepID=A0ABR6SEY6_ANAVA|nr:MULTISPECIES: hypothetical protein [Nostocaceae]MBC1213581.1 hypothetical protein [Trichormus variabilis ARAD]MBC1255614.1 hypothetical protein [Trichormus variabilis V5]MBC1269822.1 hypothetical protein [Trichormus variabilis FSR]MBC1304933.1 hypothetical protein [Trichormus variabilis N2B]MBC1312174.1 hypothetical protein [Trichormus variabilis PNB]
MGVPSGSKTPIHDDCLGVDFLCKGSPDETLYSRVDGGNLEIYAELKVVEVRSLQPDDKRV